MKSSILSIPLDMLNFIISGFSEAGMEISDLDIFKKDPNNFNKILAHIRSQSGKKDPLEDVLSKLMPAQNYFGPLGWQRFGVNLPRKVKVPEQLAEILESPYPYNQALKMKDASFLLFIPRMAKNKAVSINLLETWFHGDKSPAFENSRYVNNREYYEIKKQDAVSFLEYEWHLLLTGNLEFFAKKKFGLQENDMKVKKNGFQVKYQTTSITTASIAWFMKQKRCEELGLPTEVLFSQGDYRLSEVENDKRMMLSVEDGNLFYNWSAKGKDNIKANNLLIIPEIIFAISNPQKEVSSLAKFLNDDELAKKHHHYYPNHNGKGNS